MSKLGSKKWSSKSTETVRGQNQDCVRHYWHSLISASPPHYWTPFPTYLLDLDRATCPVLAKGISDPSAQKYHESKEKEVIYHAWRSEKDSHGRGDTCEGLSKMKEQFKDGEGKEGNLRRIQEKTYIRSEKRIWSVFWRFMYGSGKRQGVRLDHWKVKRRKQAS